MTPDPAFEIPLSGPLVTEKAMPRGWARSLSIASAKMDALMGVRMRQVDRSDAFEMRMWSLFVPFEDMDRRIDADFLVGSQSVSSRSLRIKSGGSSVILTLDLHESEHPVGWTYTKDVSWEHSQAVFTQFASLLRRVSQLAQKTVQADVSPRRTRAETITRAMSHEGSSWIRMPWSMGDGFISDARTLGPCTPIPKAWRGARTTMAAAERDDKGLIVTLSPISTYVPRPSAIDAMRAIASLPPMELAS